MGRFRIDQHRVVEIEFLGTGMSNLSWKKITYLIYRVSMNLLSHYLAINQHPTKIIEEETQRRMKYAEPI